MSRLKVNPAQQHRLRVEGYRNFQTRDQCKVNLDALEIAKAYVYSDHTANKASKEVAISCLNDMIWAYEEILAHNIKKSEVGLYASIINPHMV